MGFRPAENEYKLVFEDPALNGLEVTVAEVTTGDLITLAELVSEVEGKSAVAKAKAVGTLFAMLGEALVSWNVEGRKGQAVPADEAGVRRQTLRFNLAIVHAWMSAMAEVDIPLPNGSSDGGTNLEPSIPMEPVSPNPGS